MTDDADRSRRLQEYQADPVEVNRRVVEEYRANQGRLGPPFRGPSHMLLLTTTGARSGEPRTAPMMYVRDGDRLVVFASNMGAPTHPAWYRNLVAHPEATVEVGGDAFPVRAETARGAERARLWTLFPFPEHQERAGREIPVVVLRRRNVPGDGEPPR
jgi:deazaflavin-dependent oxidoreductase (nitroreductase family)